MTKNDKMKYGILGLDGSTNGMAYDTPEDAQRQIDQNKRGWPQMWSAPCYVVEYWVLECVMFCKDRFPGAVERWKRYEFTGME